MLSSDPLIVNCCNLFCWVLASPSSCNLVFPFIPWAMFFLFRDLPLPLFFTCFGSHAISSVFPCFSWLFLFFVFTTFFSSTPSLFFSCHFPLAHRFTCLHIIYDYNGQWITIIIWVSHIYTKAWMFKKQLWGFHVLWEWLGTIRICQNLSAAH